MIYEEIEDNPINVPVTADKLNEVLTNIKISSPGPDDKAVLLEIFNIIWLDNVFRHE